MSESLFSRLISRMYSLEARSEALEERIEELSEDATSRFARGSVLTQDGFLLTEKDMEARREKIRSRLSA